LCEAAPKRDHVHVDANVGTWCLLQTRACDVCDETVATADYGPICVCIDCLIAHEPDENVFGARELIAWLDEPNGAFLREYF